MLLAFSLSACFTIQTSWMGCTVCERVWSEVQVLSRYAYSGLELKATALPRGGVGSTGGKRAVRRITNSIRPGILASLHPVGEVQSRRSCMLKDV